MSQESALAYAEKLKSDDGFRQQVADAGSADERKQIIEGAGFDVDASDKATVEGALSGGELSDSELENVSGGGGIGVFGSAVCFDW